MSTYTQRNHNNVLASELTLGEVLLIGHQVLQDHYKLLFLIGITALFPLLLLVRERNHLAGSWQNQIQTPGYGLVHPFTAEFSQQCWEVGKKEHYP